MPVVGPGKATKSEAPTVWLLLYKGCTRVGTPTSDSVSVIANIPIRGIINIATMLPYFQNGL